MKVLNLEEILLDNEVKNLLKAVLMNEDKLRHIDLVIGGVHRVLILDKANLIIMEKKEIDKLLEMMLEKAVCVDGLEIDLSPECAVEIALIHEDGNIEKMLLSRKDIERMKERLAKIMRGEDVEVAPTDLASINTVNLIKLLLE